MTPDPSLAPVAVWVVGMAGDPAAALTAFWELLTLGVGVLSFLLGGLLLSSGLRRT